MSNVGDWVIEKLFSWSTVFRYNAKFSDGKINLKLSVRHDANQVVMEQWKQSFIQASKILFHATDGQLQFGKIQFANNSLGSNGADAYLYECEGESLTGSKMYLCGDERFHPYIVVHEFGHHAFNLGDEYETISSDPAFCSNDPSTQRCIMEHKPQFGDSIDPTSGLITSGTVNEFCDETNHDVTSGNTQQVRNKCSCWNTIVKTPPFAELVVPSPQRTFSDVGHMEVVWEELLGHQRFLFVLDITSASKAKLAGIVDALATWADYCRQTRSSMGLVGASGEILFDLQPVDTDQKRLQIIAVLAKLTLPVVGLRVAANQAPWVFSKMPLAANQTLVWITENGLDGDSLKELAIQLRQLDVHAYPVVIGSGSPELDSFARETGGVANFVPTISDANDGAFAIQTAILTLSADLIENAGILGYEEMVWHSMAELAKHDGMSLTAGKDAIMRVRVGELPLSVGRDLPFYVEEGCERLTFMLSSTRAVELVLISPEGTIVSRRRNENDEGSGALHTITNPSRGVWTARVLRNLPSETKVALIAISENKRLQVDFDYVVAKDASAIGLKLFALFDNPIDNLAPLVNATSNELNEDRATAKLYPASSVVSNSSLSSALAIGTYLGQIPLDRSGNYTLVAKLRNLGTALKSGNCKCDKSFLANLTPPFERVVRRQLIVK